MQQPVAPEDDEISGPRAVHPGIWEAIQPRILALIRSHRTTIVFTNSRLQCEKLCQRLNELAGVHGVRFDDLPDDASERYVAARKELRKLYKKYCPGMLQPGAIDRLLVPYRAEGTEDELVEMVRLKYEGGGEAAAREKGY